MEGLAEGLEVTGLAQCPGTLALPLKQKALGSFVKQTLPFIHTGLGAGPSPPADPTMPSGAVRPGGLCQAVGHRPHTGLQGVKAPGPGSPAPSRGGVSSAASGQHTSLMRNPAR